MIDLNEIIRMAREAGLHSAVLLHLYNGREAALTDNECDELRRLARFATLVEKHLIASGYRKCAEGQRTTQFCGQLEAAVAGAVAAEREKSLRLWMLLDDVDTADDIAKSDDIVYRSLCRQAHQKRWNVLTGDEVDAAIRARGEK